MTSINFKDLAGRLLSQADGLLLSWLPGAKKRGKEYVIGDIYGSPGDSLSINTHTGVWKDFATDEGGSDLISLYAAIHGLSQGDAARALDDGASIPAGSNVTHLPVRKLEWDGIFPIPAHAGPPPTHHPRHGAPTHRAAYKDRQGRTLAWVYRCEPDRDSKQVGGWHFSSLLSDKITFSSFVAEIKKLKALFKK